MVFAVHSANAAMRCERRIMDKGASTYEMLKYCGQPVLKQTLEEPVETYSSTYIQSLDVEARNYALQEAKTRYRTIERWTYEMGAGDLVREVDFYNGEVIEIRTRGRR